MAEYEDARTRVVAIEELADLLELIHATAAVHWASFEQLDEVRKEKENKRGGLDARIFLLDVEGD